MNVDSHPENEPNNLRVIDEICEHRTRVSLSEALHLHPGITKKNGSLEKMRRVPVSLSVPIHPILVVSDHPVNRVEITSVINEGNFHAMDCSFESLSTTPPPQMLDFSLLIIDTDHLNRSFSELISFLNRYFPEIPVILLGKSSSQHLTSKDRPRFLLGCLCERDSETLLVLVHSGLTIYKRIREGIELSCSQGIPAVPFNMGLTSESPLIKQMWAEILEKSDIPNAHVLLMGEWGTRCDLIASQIHVQGPQRNACFDMVPMDTINGEFLEPLLFGYEPGTNELFPEGFVGKIEMANHGTLYLSNVDCMSFTIQKRLYAFLKNGSLYRMHSQKPRICNTRIIVSGSGNLYDLVECGVFMPELYELLSEHTIMVPTFRKIRDSIPKMTLVVAEWLCQRVGRKTPVFEPDALEKLRRYSWPFNTIEYEHVMRRIILSNKTGVITAKDVVFDMALNTKKCRISSLVGQTLEEIEREVILETLQTQDGNRSTTAKILGISEKTLYNKLKNYAENG